jgi:glycosyltransferase involved in cell wall biosynthesis
VLAAITMPWGRRLGGAEEMMWGLLRHVDRTRLEPRVIFLEPGPFEREVAALGLETHVVGAGRLRQPTVYGRTLRSLRAVLRDERPDLVLNWSPKTHLYAGLLARSVPAVWWQHGVPDGHWLDRLATALPAAAVGCSSRASASAQQQLRPRRETFVVHPGIELPAPTSAGLRAEVLRALGVPEDRLVVGIVGRLQPWKGQHHFLRALALLADEGLPVHGLVIGGDAYGLSPDYPATLRDLVRQLRIDSRVTMTGQVDDAVALVAGMDVLVSASTAEPFGIVLLESMARGVPTVAVETGGPAEIIEADRSGVLVPTPEPRVLASAVGRVLRDPELRRGLARAGRERVAARFTVERMASGFQAAIERIAGGRRA